MRFRQRMRRFQVALLANALVGCSSPPAEPPSADAGGAEAGGEDASDIGAIVGGDRGATGDLGSIGNDVASDAFRLECTGAGDCDDRAACTDDMCVSGACVHTPVSARCDDSIECTDDRCVAGMCQHTAVPARCRPGQMCDMMRGCQGGRICGADGDCLDTDPCTTHEHCDPVSRICQYAPLDGDMDGHPPLVCGGDDCDDSRASVYPGRTETCNGMDDDCDGNVDDAPAGTECGAGFLCREAVCTCPPSTPASCPTTAGRGCFDLMASVQNCGACAQPCGSMGTSSTACTAGHCTPVCATGFGNCDSNGVNGCETATTTAVNCGSCGHQCPTDASCLSGVCVCSGAMPMVCSGACRDLATDPVHCGACGHACVGDTRCFAGACVAAPPRQIAPLSTATTTSQRPTFRWSLGAGVDGARLEICSTRACATIEQSIDAIGSSAVPTSSLAPGLHYWRLRGRSGSAAASVVGPVWEVMIGQRSAAVDASWGTFADFNGDGIADLVIGAPGATTSSAGRIYLYLGGASGLATTPTATINGPDGPGSFFGSSAANAGDVNGDGYPDAIVGAQEALSGAGRTHLYLGSATGLATTPATDLNAPTGTHSFGATVAGAGDVNGDGYSDVVVGAYVGTDLTDFGRHAYYLFLGSAIGLSRTPAATLPDEHYYTVSHGLRVVSVGDVNGDGFGDIVAGADCAPIEFTTCGPGQVYLYLGSASGLATTPAIAIRGPDGANGYFGIAVANAGDVNGDGYADLAVGAHHAIVTRVSGSASINLGTGRAYVYQGGPDGFSATPVTTLIGPAGLQGEFGGSVASAGDVNRDGFADVVVGAVEQYVRGSPGHAYIYLGSASGLSTAPVATLNGPDGAGSQFGRVVFGVGDVNRDGFPDLAVASSSELAVVHIYVGGVSGTAALPALTLTSPGGPDGFGRSL